VGREGGCDLDRVDCKSVENSLDGYILGELDAEAVRLIEQHLATCAACREKVALIAGVAKAVRDQESAGLGSHLPTETIVDLAMDPASLEPGRRVEAHEHLRLCEPCRTYYEAALAAVREPGSTDAPDTAGTQSTDFWHHIRVLFARRWAPAWAAVAAVVAVAILLYRWEPGPPVHEGVEIAEPATEAIVPQAEEAREAPAEAEAGETQAAAAGEAEAGWRPIMARAERAARAGDGARAVALADSAWLVGSSELGPTDSDYWFASWRDTVPRRVYVRSYEDTDSLITRMLRIREKVLGPEHLDIALDLDDLAVLREREWRHEETVSLRERALAIREKALDPLDPEVERSLTVLAHHYNHLGRYSDAEPLYERDLDLRKRIYGPRASTSPEAAGTLAKGYDNLAHLYLRLGRLAEAEELYLGALEVRTAGLPPDDASIGANLTYLGNVEWALGRLDQAEDYYRRGLEIREKALGPDHADVAASMSALADVLVVQGGDNEAKYEEAETLYERVLEIRRANLENEQAPPAHPGIAMALHSLAVLNTKRGRYADAKPLYEEALRVWHDCFGFDHPRSVGTITDLAYNYLKMGEFKAADDEYAKALALAERTYGAKNQVVADVLEATSFLRRREERCDDALALAGRAVGIGQAVFRRTSVLLNEPDALAFSHSLARSVANYLSCYLDAGAPEGQVREAADIVLANKGPVSDEIFERQRALLVEDDPDTRALLASLKNVTSRLAQAYTAGLGGAGDYAAGIDSLEDLASGIEAQLAKVSSVVRDRRERVEPTAAMLASLLPEGSALVEYLRFDYIDPATEKRVPRYAAVVLRDGGDPKFFDLGEAAVIDEHMGDYAGHMVDMAALTHQGRPPSASAEAAYARISDDLYASVWRPVESELAGTDMVLIAPDGALNLLSFGGLETAPGAYLIESRRIHYLTSGRDLLRLRGGIETGRGLLAMGDPDYGVPEGEEQPPAQPGTESLLLAYDRTRGALPTCEEFKAMRAAPLPGTKSEIEAVEASWREHTGEPAVVYLGADATEARFKAEAPGRRVVHIATHGYVLGTECGASSRPGFGVQDRYFAGANPLLLSGLLLAGANTTLAGAGRKEVEGRAGDDGILTAYDVSALDLGGTDLVVLSACETARGKVEEGEGAYGLRRAFQMAGARTVISALWEVPDRITSEMMGELYSDPERPAAEALRTAQIDTIHRLRAAGRSDHPYFWAAFLAAGDWR